MSYKNIAVPLQTYENVAKVAEANDRGLGAQITVWANAAMPECGHDKQKVSVEIVSGVNLVNPPRKGLYCPLCRRVYPVGE